jgi:hypothetical protein
MMLLSEVHRLFRQYLQYEIWYRDTKVDYFVFVTLLSVFENALAETRTDFASSSFSVRVIGISWCRFWSWVECLALHEVDTLSFGNAHRGSFSHVVAIYFLVNGKAATGRWAPWDTNFGGTSCFELHT